MPRYEPGIRVGAIRDSDSKNVNLFGYGVYLGNEETEIMKGFAMANPKIQLDNGQIVWGYQCWWGPEEQIKKHIGERHVNVVPVVVRSTEEVTND